MSTPLVYLRDIQTRPVVFTVWEKIRNREQVHWAMECLAETVSGLPKLLSSPVVNIWVDRSLLVRLLR
jgi:hypothetical protein